MASGQGWGEGLSEIGRAVVEGAAGDLETLGSDTDRCVFWEDLCFC